VLLLLADLPMPATPGARPARLALLWALGSCLVAAASLLLPGFKLRALASTPVELLSSDGGTVHVGGQQALMVRHYPLAGGSCHLQPFLSSMSQLTKVLGTLKRTHIHAHTSTNSEHMQRANLSFHACFRWCSRALSSHSELILGRQTTLGGR